ncbi:Ycf66 family protein [Calothrix sp. PCC 6303]|uniref:Ycf66 family protein n=1 Tax=Calothrix sp. PCC 6303 TaxID=1170562 RepID=UPI0002A05981|nr:Ycf66 family protein [Calothrix sp. PCC 6303]AFZ03752.1 Ycf66 family protein [Calothrix sp. PCC 6303]
MVIFGLNSASVLAQINVGATPASFLGIFLAVAGAGLYFLRSVKPELARDYDIFFAAVGLLCGFILIFQGWRLDPILQFSQLLLVGSTVFFAYDSIRLRKIATEQAKRDTPIVDRERRVSDDYRYGGNNRRPYQAERMDADYESLPYYEDDEDGRPQRRITESRENRSSRSNRETRDDSYYDDDAPVNRSSRRNTSSNTNNSDRSETASRGSSRRGASRPSSRNPERSDEEDWGTPSKPIEDDWENSGNREEKRSRRRKDSSSEPSVSSQRPSMYEDDVQVTPKPKRRRPASDSAPKRDAYGGRSDRINDDEMIPTTDYVDYKPIDRDEEPRNPINFDDDTPIT